MGTSSPGARPFSTICPEILATYARLTARSACSEGRDVTVCYETRHSFFAVRRTSECLAMYCLGAAMTALYLADLRQSGHAHRTT